MQTLLSIAALLVLASSAGARPNIVVIMADDIGLECYTPYGGESYRTPTAERLAREGVRFTARLIVIMAQDGGEGGRRNNVLQSRSAHRWINVLSQHARGEAEVLAMLTQG